MIKDKNLRDQKLTDWPAFKASGLKTVKEFKDSYFKLSISGVNEGNIGINIEGNKVGDEELRIISSKSISANKKEIGERIFKVYHACIATRN